MMLLDTHVLIWLLLDNDQLGEYALSLIRSSWADGDIAVSAITFWEIAMLHKKGRLSLISDIESWRAELLESGLTEIAVDGQIGIRAVSLEDFHADPADRMIVATALEGYRLVTADRRILDWSGRLDCLNARE